MMFSYQAKSSNKGSLCSCLHYLHAQRHLLLGIILVMSLATVIFEFCVITAELLSRPPELSLQLSSRLALHTDQTHKSQSGFPDNLDYLHAHVLKRRHNMDELKTMLKNARTNVNKDDSLSSTEHSSYDKLNVKTLENDHQGTSTTENVPDESIPVSKNYVQGIDPPTLSLASNSVLEQFPTHGSIRENKLYPTQSSQVKQPMDSQIRGQTEAIQLTSDVVQLGSSKKKKSPKQFELSKDYPLFESPYPPPVVNGQTCRDGLCSEFLRPQDLYSYKTCLTKQRSKSTYADAKPGPCHFINGTNRAAVALSSFPGSGNTWVRGLLEKATGVCTGAIYCDKSIRASGMNGEGIRSGVVVAVKTHKSRKVTWTDSDSPQTLNNGKATAYGSVILVVRNPYRALIAEWNRLNAAWHIATTNHSNGHIGSTGKEQFGENGGWKSFIKRKLPVWQAYFQEWVVEGHRHNKSVLVVRYEDLKLDTFKEVKRMLEFLNFEYREEELRQRLTAGFSTFQRKPQEIFEHFTKEQRHIVDTGIAASIDYLKLNNHGDTLRLADYLGTIA